MITIDNLNLDCLELIFAYLSGNDLVSASLVNRSFLAGVIPRLYRSLVFRLNQAKRYPAILSPFASVLAHPNLAGHVRRIDIRTIPNTRSSVQPHFLLDCARTIAICQNLVSFICTPPILSSFLPSLQQKWTLQYLRVNANLTQEQAELLATIRGLKSITLDGSPGTAHIVNVLPRWVSLVKGTLRSLTLCAMHDLNACVLESILRDLPELIGLHVISCSIIDHITLLHLTEFTPKLESLSFTTYESPPPLGLLPPLRRLKHLAVDCRCMVNPSATPALWTSLIAQTRLWSAPLTSFTLKLSDRLLVSETFIKDMLDAHASTLAHFALINAVISNEGLSAICSRCADLERLVITIPKGICPFAMALSASNSLRVLVDPGESHSSHGRHSYVSKHNILTIMQYAPRLEKVIADRRVWSRPMRFSEQHRVCPERQKPSSVHWFMPPSQGMDA
ncbi:uncharacterized protein LAESUDRAFT_724132 [Laetiporus sulphureus 93-53]|uniref:F-box domain-containing protein n=1 Tax=Laetiporus sulphureus 93-53 TaxID=1314785 RepID=A0A165F0V9_9APHY|nr:uncharacterized protein LAESUDRAFT_724132 [Laetiporus sulphureus 93-53]KZT08130.1 hypothetical protein LAESUDRAFT_724132 [Laetiporus sulphureus 93-53]